MSRVKERAKRVGEGEQAQAKPVEDLLVCSKFVPEGTRKMLEAVSNNLALVELADTDAGENACVDKLSEPFATWKYFDLARVTIRNLIRELCHYRPEVRKQVICAAIVRARQEEASAARLKEMMPAIQKALLELEPRILAISAVMAKLEIVGGAINVAFLREAINPVLHKGRGKVDMLRRERKLSVLMEAYDLARVCDR